MSWIESSLQVLKKLNITLVPYLPDDSLRPLIDAIEADSDFDTVALTREEEGIGVVAGAFLGGRRSLLIMQASGIGNCYNAITSLTIPQRLPALMLISQRGELGETNYSQTAGGRGLRGAFDAFGIQHATPASANDLPATLAGAADYAFGARLPIGIVLTKAALKEVR